LEYWETRYKSGGSSGAGSVGRDREWKWGVIASYVSPVDDVIDVGCGDLSFWDRRNCQKYLGLDVSQTVIEKNRFVRPYWRFCTRDAEIRIEGERARIVLCLDVLFHVIDEGKLNRILNNLCYYSNEWIFVYTWSQNPFALRWQLHELSRALATLDAPGALAIASRVAASFFKETISDDVYQRYRRFDSYLPIFTKNGFRVVGRRKIPWGIGEMFVFCKRNKTMMVPQ
jgi:hypothetical protein